VCLPVRLVSGRRTAQSASESSDVVAWRSKLKGAVHRMLEKNASAWGNSTMKAVDG